MFRFCMAAVLSFGVVARAGDSQWVREGPDGKLVYQATPTGDRIMDFSYAGYEGGGVALPDVPVVKTIQPSGGADDTAIIQKALDDVGKLPLKNGFRGAVLLTPGTFKSSQTIVISNSGIVLRGSGNGTNDGPVSTIQLTGRPHLAISVRNGSRFGRRGAGSNAAGADSNSAHVTLADSYVPSGSTTFNVTDASGFKVGDVISIRRPVTETWIRFMGMDDMVRNDQPQTWIRQGTTIDTTRTISGLSGNAVTVDVPLSDSFDSRYLNPPGTVVVKIRPPELVSQCGVENLHVQCPGQAINHTQPHFQALRITGEDCWARDLILDETMNSVGFSGRRITCERVAVRRKIAHVGASKPAEFAPNADQILLDRCSVSGDDVWFTATGAEQAGPIVILNCTFRGDGAAESHQRWSTGILYDNCRAPEGEISLRNRGSMGSGHGWTMGWGVVWNCVARDFIVQNPPGAVNWLIGSRGEARLAPRPFGKGPNLPQGIVDSPGNSVAPQSLYLTQLEERLGPQAVKNVGYSSVTDLGSTDETVQPPPGK